MTTKESVTPFQWIDSVLERNDDLMEEHGEKPYPAFMVARGLSQHPDAIMHAQEVNLLPGLDNRLHYDYLRLSVRKGKRRKGKWAKKNSVEGLEVVMGYYGFGPKKALDALRVLSQDQLKVITEEMKAREP